MARKAEIERLFTRERVEDILAALYTEGTDWARKTAAIIRTKSPTSLKIALEQVRCGAHWDFAECMRAEFRIVSRIVHGFDFYEGVRAVIVDKDNAPQWRPPELGDVSEAEVARHFAPLGRELDIA